MILSNCHLLRSTAKSDLRLARDFPLCSCWRAKFANKLQQHGVSLQFITTDQLLAHEAIKKWELNWLVIRREEEHGDPEEKEIAYKARDSTRRRDTASSSGFSHLEERLVCTPTYALAFQRGISTARL
jgi:hypothetical protein